MGKHLLRHDKECQNCGRTVEEKFCPNCGQKNTETRQSFAHLFTHFVEDLTHYDTAFWKTIKYLLFRPARLTLEYLAGKRQSYVPPVKLYIFISFVTFFIPAILPDTENSEVDSNYIKIEADNQVQPIQKNFVLNKTVNVYPRSINSDKYGFYIDNPVAYTSIAQMDSIEKIKPETARLSSFEYKIAKKLILLYQKNTRYEVGEKFGAAFWHNIPKALFVYMPVFAFWLWFFHGKKRWYFFDHGIFTLHYFSFLLLTVSFLIVLFQIATVTKSDLAGMIFGFMVTATVLWQIYYFYRAHRKMYAERWITNAVKSTLMFIINFISIIVIVILFLLYTYFNLH